MPGTGGRIPKEATMKRAGILLLTLLLIGVVAAPAHATPPAQAKAVDQSRAEVVE